MGPPTTKNRGSFPSAQFPIPSSVYVPYHRFRTDHGNNPLRESPRKEQRDFVSPEFQAT